jgi:D-tyrosyl-tRNA(Tyr) deacylase
LRLVVQRVSRASVAIDGRVTAEIGAGMLVLAAVGKSDTAATLAAMAEKVVNLRIFDDAEGKMNLSLAETGGEILAVSQFTLYGDVRRGRRPGFDAAAPPAEARALFGQFVAALGTFGPPVATGVFQAHMAVELVNDGPVTILIDSGKAF